MQYLYNTRKEWIMSNNFSHEDTTEDALPGFFVDAEGRLHRGVIMTVTDENNQEVQMGLDGVRLGRYAILSIA